MTIVTVTVPTPGRKVSTFRRKFIAAIRRAVRQSVREGAVDCALGEEMLRALPLTSRART